jgi:hypothetical protein
MANLLTLQFKQKHMGYCANFMGNISMDKYFYLASAIRQVLLAGTYGPDDLITIGISSDDLISLYAQLGEKPEKLANTINSDMKDLLLPQLISIIEGNDTDQASTANNVLNILGAMDANNQAMVQSMIDSGICWLTK